MSFRDRCFHGIHLSQPCELCGAEEPVSASPAQVSEPKTPAEFRCEYLGEWVPLTPAELHDALTDTPKRYAIEAIATRDEQIRQQERARVEALVNKLWDQARVAEMERDRAAALGIDRGRQWERSEWEARIASTHVSKERVRELCDAAKATGMALEMARVREVLLDRLRWNRPRGFDAAVSETLGIAMDLGIDLERASAREVLEPLRNAADSPPRHPYTPARTVLVPGCTCLEGADNPCPACARHFDLEGTDG